MSRDGLWLAENLGSTYEGVSVLSHEESEGEIRLRLSRPLSDPQTSAFRSRPPVLNDLAINHRLSLWLGRRRHGLPEDAAFAAKSMAGEARGIARSETYELAVRFELENGRRRGLSILTATVVTRHGVEARTTTASFSVLPRALANFVRRERRFLDFAEVAIVNGEPGFSAAGENRLRYGPSEADRLSDGARVDHVPALTLIDLAFDAGRAFGVEASDADVTADFLAYTDPRLPLELLWARGGDGRGAVDFLQGGEPVARVEYRERRRRPREHDFASAQSGRSLGPRSRPTIDSTQSKTGR